VSGPSTKKEHLARLEKRAAWLAKRIAEAEEATGPRRTGELSHDRAELAALRWAIGKLTPMVESG
jgi:hypothetical protein